MKKKIVYKISTAVFLTLAVCMLASCNKEELDYDITGDPVNRVYINTETSYVNTYKFGIVHTPINSQGNIIAKFPVRCTREAPSGVQVTIGLDNSLVDQYNSSKAAMYSQVTESMVTLGNPTLTIPAGAMISSDSVSVSIPSEYLTNLRDDGYLLPLVIKSITQTEGVEISSNLNTVYLFVSTEWTNCYDYQVDTNMVGSLVTDRSLWTAGIDVSLYSGSLTQMLDGSTNSYFQIRPPVKFNMVVDLSEEVSGITGIRTNSRQTSYGFTQVKVYTSNDSINWVYQGSPFLMTSSSYQYIKFYEPVDARYLRIELVSSRSTSRIYIAEFDIYREDV